MMAAKHSTFYGHLRPTFGSWSQAKLGAGDFDGGGLYWRASLDVVHNGWGQVWLCVIGSDLAYQFGEVSIPAGRYTLHRSDWIDLIGGVSAP